MPQRYIGGILKEIVVILIISIRISLYALRCEFEETHANNNKNSMRFEFDDVLSGLRRWWGWGHNANIHNTTIHSTTTAARGSA